MLLNPFSGPRKFNVPDVRLHRLKAHNRYLCFVIFTCLISGLSPAQEAKHLKTPPRTLGITKFYEAPNPLPPGKSGQLIRFEPTDDYDLPEGISAVRILYHSRDANGRDVPASAIVLVPEAASRARQLPVLAWAHAFTGAARNCAPSLQRNLFQGPYLVMYAKLGYAVVATDYAGLGTDGRNAVMDIGSNANDVIYAVEAARAAVPRLDTKWIAVGEVVGANAVIAAAERPLDDVGSGFLGSVAIGDIASLQPSAITSSPKTSVLFAYSVKTTFPQVAVRDILTDNGMSLYDQLERSCAVEAKLPGPILQPNWQANKNVKSFLERNQLGRGKSNTPILVLSYQDTTSAGTAHTVQDLCNRGDRIEFQQYSVSPGTLLGSTVRDQMAWIQDRFAGRAAPTTCK